MGASPIQSNPTIRQPGLSVLLAALLFGAAAMRLWTAHNDFPLAYHPDEPSKVEQVQTGDFNFHHPPMLLQLTRGLLRFQDTPNDAQTIVETGRTASALLASATLVLAVLLSSCIGGRTAALAAGILLLTGNQLFELSHYFKEDPAMAFGVLAGLLSLFLYQRWPNILGAAALGAGGALAASGKYVGVVVTVLLLIPMFWPGKDRVSGKVGGHLAAFAVTLVAVFALINFPLLQHFAEFQTSFGREMEFVVQGHKGMTREVPHLAYTAAFSKNLTPALWVGLLVFYLHLIKARRAAAPAILLTAVWPVFYVILLSFSPKENDRYFLPATVVFTVLAAAGLCILAQILTRSRPLRNVPPRAILPVLVVLALAIQMPRTLEYYRAFKVDDRKELAQWLQQHFPAGMAFVQDNRVKMPPPGQDLPFRDLSDGRFAADAGSLQSLRERGVRLVMISESDYGRFFRSSLKPVDSQREEFERRKHFYEELVKTTKCVWERPRSKVIYLHPGLKVFDLSAQDAQPASTP